MKQKDEFSSLFHDKLQKAEMNVPADAWSGLLNDLHMAESAQQRPAFFVGRAWWAAAASVAVLLGLAVWLWQGAEPAPEAESLVQNAMPAASAPTSLPDDPPIAAEQGEKLQVNIRQLPVALTSDAYFLGSEEPDPDELVEVTVTIRTQVYGTNRPVNNGGYTSASQEVVASTSETQQPTEPQPSPTAHQGQWSIALTAGSAWPSGDHQAPVSAGLMLKKELSPALALEAGLRFTHYPVNGATDVQTLSLPVQLDVTLAESKNAKVYAAVGGAIEKSLGHDFKEDPLLLSARGGVGVEYRISDRLALYAEPAVSYRLNDRGQSSYLHTAHRAALELTGGLRMSF